MYFKRNAADAANEILSAFRHPNSLPAPRNINYLCRKAWWEQSRAVGSLDLSAQELVHAADYLNGTWNDGGPCWQNETVATFGGAILFKCLGYDHEADLRSCWAYIREWVKPHKLSVVKACKSVLERTCKAVMLIRDTHSMFRAEMLREKLESEMAEADMKARRCNDKRPPRW